MEQVDLHEQRDVHPSPLRLPPAHHPRAAPRRARHHLPRHRHHPPPRLRLRLRRRHVRRTAIYVPSCVAGVLNANKN